MRHHFSRLLTLTVVLGSFVPALRATTIVLPDDTQLVDKTEYIAKGRVLSTQAVDVGGGIWTDTTLLVEDVLKGELPATITIRELGGELNERFNVVFGAAEYEAGQTVLVFLSRDDKLAGGTSPIFRTRDMFVGRFVEKKTSDGTRLWFRPKVANTRLLDGKFEEIDGPTRQRKADGFERFIRDRVAGRALNRDYETDATIAGSGSSSSISAQFTLISEPRIYRWFAFDQGQTVNWYSISSQPGYSGGGVNEIRSAMAIWTNYAGANIRYSFAGTSPSPAGGMDRPNGIHEVIFNDVTNDIEGTYSSRTGGVVGLGGFNNASYAGSWTSPFAADATHPAKRYSDAYKITEANLVIQDGVTAASGISSSVLAEIVAHEFGHTLGFGHSADGSALMYAFVTGGGASLKPDDQAAARWLYPNASPQVTAAFAFSPSAPTTDQTVTFTDQSSGASSWSWNFGDGTTSTSQNPSKRYANPGTYNVTLTASNGSTTASSTRSISVTAGAGAGQTLTADFSFSPATPAAGQTVTFSDRTTGGASSWSWSFGDGTTSTAQNPSKVFANGGSYTVTLTVGNSSGSSSKSRAISVTGSGATGTYRTWLPVSADTAGSGSTWWRTELTIFNAGANSASVSIVFIPSAGGAARNRTVSIGSNASITWASALRDLFGLSSGAGALAIEATSSGTPLLRVTSRTYTDGASGTYGQGVPAATEGDAPAVSWLAGVASSADYRTNIGLVNRSGAPVVTTLTLRDANGAIVGENAVTTQANTFQQLPITSIFPQLAGGSFPTLSLRLSSTASGAIFAYASVVDNRSQDPIYFGATGQEMNAMRVVPAIGKTAGANGTYWRSDVTLFNPGSTSSTVRLRYLPAGSANSAAAARSVTIGAMKSLAISDVVAWFGLASGSGTLEVSSTGTLPLIAARTYTNRVGESGTYGQSVDSARASKLSGTAVVTGLKHDSRYRSNVGVYNNADGAATVSLTLLSSSGSAVASAAVSIPARSQTQLAASALFPNVNLSSLGSFTVRANSNTPIAAYGSVVDNTSGDPIYIAGE